MKKLLFVLLCCVATTAASCDVRIGDRGPNSNPVTPTNPIQPEIVISSFIAEPGTTVFAGTTITLRWSVSNATTCRIDPSVGDVNSSGFTQLTLVNSATFTLTCTSGLKTASRILTVVVIAK